MPTINFVSWNSRTNRISIIWVNHNGWIDIFVIKENYFFSSYFQHISLCFYSKFKRESSLDAEFDSASNQYPHCILLMDPAAPKTRNTLKTWWWCHHHIFSGISYFSGSEVHQKYALWVLVGCRIWFCIQQALSIEFWVKTQGDMSKIWTKKVVFYDTYPQIYIKKVFKTYTVFQI